ncbi:MAG: hypothetical protein ABIE42_10225 [Candidatus Eisenbacteria bacterium]
MARCRLEIRTVNRVVSLIKEILPAGYKFALIIYEPPGPGANFVFVARTVDPDEAKEVMMVLEGAANAVKLAQFPSKDRPS